MNKCNLIRGVAKNTPSVPRPDVMGCCQDDTPSDFSQSPQKESPVKEKETAYSAIFKKIPQQGKPTDSTANKKKMSYISTGKKSRRSTETARTQIAHFQPKQNPKIIKRLDQQRSGYIWLATYTPDLVLPAKIRELINDVPAESHQVQIKDYQLAYGKKKNEVHPFVQKKKDGVIITQVYLVEKEQFCNLIHLVTGCQPFRLPEQIALSQSIPLVRPTYQKKSSFYSQVTKLCELENLDVLALTSEPILQTPPIPLLSSLFDTYMQVFTNYTEHFVLYYLYGQEQVRSAYTCEDLLYVAVPRLLERARNMQEQQPTIAMPTQQVQDKVDQRPGKGSPWQNISSSPKPRATPNESNVAISNFRNPINISHNIGFSLKMRQEDRRESLGIILEKMSDKQNGLGGKIVPAFSRCSPGKRSVFGNTTQKSQNTQSEISEMGALEFCAQSNMSLSGFSVNNYNVLGCQ